MAGSDGLWYGARIYGETARPLPFPNHQAMPEKRGMGNRLSCYYKETTGTPNRHHRFLSPGAFSLKIRNHIIVLWRISGIDRGSGGGGAADRKLPNPNASGELGYATSFASVSRWRSRASAKAQEAKSSLLCGRRR